jgi:hypothetical protein
MQTPWSSLPRLLVFNLVNYAVICMISSFVSMPMESNFFVFAYTLLGIPVMIFLGAGTSLFFLITKRWNFCLANSLAYAGTFLLTYLQR